MNPADFGIKGHDKFRKGQLEALRFTMDSDNPIVIVEAPTGSGKSAIGVGLGSDDGVRILTKTKSLQAQYGQLYDTDVLYGLANYDCAENAPFGADFCTFVHNMFACPSAKSGLCSYINQRRRVQESPVQSLSYAYFLAASWTSDPKHDVGYLYCDEAHEIPELITSHMSLVLDRKEVADLGLSLWPTSFKVNSQYHRRKDIQKWLAKSRNKLTEESLSLNRMVRKKPNIARRVRWLKDWAERFAVTEYMMASRPEVVFMEVSPYRLEIVPLTASLFFRDLFVGNMQHKVVLTSATIGNPKEFASALGISSFDAMEVPSNFPPHAMPVYVPVNAPRMNHKSTDARKEAQAIIIHDLITSLHSSWNGLIHVTSIKQAEDLADRLARLGLQDRVWIAPRRGGTDEKLEAWKQELKRTPNLINISWTSHMGVDAGFADFNIIAKIPYQMLDKAGMVKMEYDKRYYQWQAAIMTMQAVGRIRRGVPSHYEEDGEPMRKFVAIVDANVWSLKRYYSNHFNNCLVKV